MAAVINLHWTATGYNWIRPEHYHSIIGGDGRVHRLHAYSVDLLAHTYGRNRNSVALSCACTGGIPDPWTQHPLPLSAPASAPKPQRSPAGGAGRTATSACNR